MEQNPHILIVDDDREIRELLARFLEKNQMRVTAVRDGREARRAWTNGHYQLVVLDLMLPGESGLDLARWMRTQSSIPIVMLTAMGDETDRVIGLELLETLARPGHDSHIRALRDRGAGGPSPTHRTTPRRPAWRRRCCPAAATSRRDRSPGAGSFPPARH